MNPLDSFFIITGLTGAATCFLALAMPRHGVKVFGPPSSRMREQAFRFTGWLLLAASLLVALGTEDGGISLVSWFALLSAQAFAVSMLLAYVPRCVAWWTTIMVLATFLPATTHVFG